MDKGATLKLTAAGADSNTGSISVSGGTMTVASGSVLTNSGTLDAETGGKLTVTGGMTNAGTLATNGRTGGRQYLTVTGKLTNSSGRYGDPRRESDTDKATVGTLANSGAVT